MEVYEKVKADYVKNTTAKTQVRREWPFVPPRYQLYQRTHPFATTLNSTDG